MLSYNDGTKKVVINDDGKETTQETDASKLEQSLKESKQNKDPSAFGDFTKVRG